MDQPATDKLRHPFSRQPIRCLLIDLTGDVTAEYLSCISESISNFFSLVCNMRSGSNRIPFFCLITFSPYCDVIFPMQRLMKSSYTKINKAAKTIEGFLKNSRKVSAASCKDYENVLRDTIAQFRKLNLAKSKSELSISLISNQAATSIKTSIVQALKRVDHEKVEEVNVFCLQSEDGFATQTQASQYEDYQLVNKVNFHEIEMEVISIQSMFDAWLQDSNNDYEHVQIHFPKTNRVIKCDVDEFLIDVSELSCGKSFQLNVDGQNCSNVPSNPMSASHSASRSSGVPITVLRVLYKLNIDEVCLSTLFGRPHMLYSSNCWRIDWEDLESNRNRFNALCHTLSINQKCLICKNATNNSTEPNGIFVVVPSCSKLLSFAISGQELMRINRKNSNSDFDIQEEYVREIQNDLKETPEMDQFNPVDFKTGLYQTLKNNLQRSNLQRTSNAGSNYSNSPKNRHFVQPRTNPRMNNKFYNDNFSTGASGQGVKRPINTNNKKKRVTFATSPS